MDRVYSYIIDTLKLCNNDTVVAAISYGPDSMVLLDILIDLRKQLGFDIICAHVNHNIREESKEEKILLEEYCSLNNVKFEFYEIPKSEDKPLTESQARNIRYNFFDEVIKKYNAKYLMTAHHGDDLVETILMRIVRGSSLKGYAGFSKETNKDNYMVVRPLLELTKDEIVSYANKNKIPYALDKTNNTEVYTRNRYRINVLPFLKKEDKDVHLKFLKYSETLNDYSRYIETKVDESFTKCFIDNKLNLSIFNKEDELIKKRIIAKILENTYQSNIDILDDKHINLFMSLANEIKPNMNLSFPLGYLLKKEYNYIELTINEEAECYSYELKDAVLLPNGREIRVVDSIDHNSNYMTRLNSKDLKLPLIVRTKEEGDKIILKGMEKSKKVKDIFIDEKIPVSIRKNQPILVDSDGNVLWIPGVKKSIFDRKENEEYDIILHYI